MMHYARIWLIFLIVFAFAPSACAQVEASKTTQVVMLGTGTPNPDPNRSGPAVAIVVNDTPYLVDFGAGVTRQTAALSSANGGEIKGLDVKLIKRAFLTHLHSDHTIGFPDIILTPWVIGRDEPLDVYGPEGIVDMADNILKAYQEDIRYRIYGPESANNTGWRVNAHTINEGEIYKDENVTVEAFKVRHGKWPNAFGYRFTTPDRVIVISGDAALDENIEKFSRGADILIFETYSATGVQSSSPAWQKYMQSNHTSTVELGELSAKVKPKLLVLYHVLFLGESEEDVISEVKQNFKGEVKIANDLDVY